jgi:NitT/TauT family transport system substrate-binding protein
MSINSRQKVMAISLVLVMVVGSGIGALFVLGTQHNGSVQTESITVGIMPSEVEALIYIARDQGYFADNNLNVTLKNYTTGLLAVNGLLNHEVDVATATDFVLVGKALANQSVTSFGAIDRYSIAYLVGRTDLGVNNISDLKGKRIGVSIGTASQFNLGRFLELNGIDTSEVTLVNVPVNRMPAALLNGSVAAVMTSTTYIDSIQSAIPDKIISWPAQSDSATTYLAVTNTSWAADNPDTIIRFLKAMDQAASFVIHDQAESQQLLCSDINCTSSYIQKVWGDHQFSLSLDQSLIYTMEDQSRWMIRNNLTSSPVPNFLNYIYFDGMEAVEPGSVNIIR